MFLISWSLDAPLPSFPLACFLVPASAKNLLAFPVVSVPCRDDETAGGVGAESVSFFLQRKVGGFRWFLVV
jgi:hypothetical protein